MKKSYIVLIIVLLLGVFAYFFIKKDVSTLESKVVLKTETGEITGVLTTPKTFHKIPVALIIAGSGPTDKNGNSAMTQNNSLQILSSELAKNGIASLRYDKRGVGESKAAGKNEQEFRFEQYVNDAIAWVKQLKQDKRFSKVVVIGHSQGSLIGMMAAQHADQFISIAGPAQTIDMILQKQMSGLPKDLRDRAMSIIADLRQGKMVGEVPPSLNAVFRPTIQPFLISWIKYNPQQEIKALIIPVLILQGTKDLQVTVDDAKKLAEANPKGHLVYINKMNHLFRIIEGDTQENLASYNNLALPIAKELVNSIKDFILKN